MIKNTEPLACEDPKFPRINARSYALHAAPTQELIAWAKRLGVEAAGKEEAIYTILCHEYGEEAANHFRESFEKENVNFLARRRRAA